MAVLQGLDTGHEAQSLYRIYRPQVFSDVVGQEHVTQTLRNALKSRPARVTHAYLFCGPRGTGKTTTARLLAKGLNCVIGPTPEPCCKCDMCMRIARGSAMDVLEIDAASNTGVDKVREVIIEKVNYAPAEGRHRVYIIDEVHQLSSHAFNALLKTLEEPPSHAVFILATTETHKVPGTILSRCQRFDFKPIAARDIIRRLEHVCKREGLEAEPTALTRIARAAEGSVRDALGILEQASAYSDDVITEFQVETVLGSVSQELLLELTDAVAQRDSAKAIILLHRAVDQGKDVKQLLVDFSGHLRDLLLLRLNCIVEELKVLPQELRERMQVQAEEIGQARLGVALEVVCEAENEMRTNSQHRLLAELALFKITQKPSTELSQPIKHPLVLTQSEEDRIEAPKPSLLVRTRPPSEAVPRVLSETAAAPQHDATVQPESIGTDFKAKGEQTDRADKVPDLHEIRDTWDEVLRAARKWGVHLHALLLDATPAAVEGDVLTLEFANQFHYDNVSEPSKKNKVAEIASGTLGYPIRIECALRAGREEVPGMEPPSGAREAPTVETESLGEVEAELPSRVSAEDVVATALDLFEGEIVGEE